MLFPQENIKQYIIVYIVLWWAEWDCSIDTDTWILRPQLVSLFAQVMKPMGSGTSFEYLQFFLPTSCTLSSFCLKGRESFSWLSAVTCHHMSQPLWSLIPFEPLCQINSPMRGRGLGVFTTVIENYLFYFQIFF